MSEARICDVCGKFYTIQSQKRRKLIIKERLYFDSESNIFNGDICDDCAGYLAFVLIDAGADPEKHQALKEMAADYIRSHTPKTDEKGEENNA